MIFTLWRQQWLSHGFDLLGYIYRPSPLPIMIMIMIIAYDDIYWKSCEII